MDGEEVAAVTCNCSCNDPEGYKVLMLPSRIFKASGRQNREVCIDNCIVDMMELLWAAGVETLGCCCGHGKQPPAVIITESEDPQKAHAVLQQDDRKWQVLQWQLTEVQP